QVAQQAIHGRDVVQRTVIRVVEDGEGKVRLPGKSAHWRVLYKKDGEGSSQNDFPATREGRLMWVFKIEPYLFRIDSCDVILRDIPAASLRQDPRNQRAKLRRQR